VRRVYASGVVGRIGALLAGVVAVPLVAVGVPLILLQQILHIRDSKILIAVCVGILVVGGVWLVVHVFVTGPVRFETDARSVRLRRGLRVTNEWQRAATVFGSLVTRQTTNGIPSGSQRVVFATTANERVEVPARWFSATAFNDLMADLAPVSALSDAVEAEATPAERSRTFTLDPHAGRMRRPVRIVVGVLLAVFFVSTGLFAAYLVGDETRDPEALVFLAATALFVAVVVLVAAVAGRRRVARIPKSITVSGSTLRVDGQTLYWGQLASIELTPPTYSGNRRRLTLVEKIGTRTSYQLGAATGAAKSAFADYAEFVDLLGRSAPDGTVRFDLR
jgi:hypothetical protein